MTEHEFSLEATFDQGTGRIRAVYLRVRAGKAARTEEVKDGVVNADYDPDGNLVGVELLGPCAIDALEKVAQQEPEAVKAFLRNGVPRGLIPAAA